MTSQISVSTVVALRKESVDRNLIELLIASRRFVALRKESVDRNTRCASHKLSVPLSLSARRAWIEILNRRFGAIHNAVALRKESVDRNNDTSKKRKHNPAVALRKESVDRNFFGGRNKKLVLMSLSARRAWIEIVMQEIAQQRKQVALRKESVDRNRRNVRRNRPNFCRSPQGERG